MQALPADVQDVFGRVLLDIQFGEVPVNARPFGEGVTHEVWKIALDFEGDTYRLAYTCFPGTIYVLDVFVKKSKSGIGTPKQILGRISNRFKLASRHYRETHDA